MIFFETPLKGTVIFFLTLSVTTRIFGLHLWCIVLYIQVYIIDFFFLLLNTEKVSWNLGYTLECFQSLLPLLIHSFLCSKSEFASLFPLSSTTDCKWSRFILFLTYNYNTLALGYISQLLFPRNLVTQSFNKCTICSISSWPQRKLTT